MDQKQAYEILGLEPGATRFEVRQAYHDLLHVWQPDRVGKNLRLQKRAQEQISQINEAYNLLEGALPKAADALNNQTPGLVPEEGGGFDELLEPAPPDEKNGSQAKSGGKGGSKGFEPVLVDMEYVPDGPPPPKVPLAARLRETKAEVRQNVARGVSTAIPFRRKYVILAILAVVVIPVATFYATQYFRNPPDQTDYSVGPAANPPHRTPVIATPAATEAEPGPVAPETPPTTSVAPATIPAPTTAEQMPTPVAVEPAAPDPRIATLAELAKLHVTPPADATQEQLDALLVRAKLAGNLAGAGFKLDPLKVSLEMLKEYQLRADLAGQINQLAGATIQASDFTLSQLRDMKLSAQLVHEIALNGTKVDLNRYTHTELEDLLRRSAVAHALQTKYGVAVDITAHSIEELQLMLANAQERAATHP